MCGQKSRDAPCLANQAGVLIVIEPSPQETAGFRIDKQPESRGPAWRDHTTSYDPAAARVRNSYVSRAVDVLRFAQRAGTIVEERAEERWGYPAFCRWTKPSLLASIRAEDAQSADHRAPVPGKVPGAGGRSAARYSPGSLSCHTACQTAGATRGPWVATPGLLVLFGRPTWHVALPIGSGVTCRNGQPHRVPLHNHPSRHHEWLRPFPA
jgi:hypothetical protein